MKRSLNLLFILASCVSLSVQAQDPYAYFSVSPGNKVCLGTPIQVTDLSGSPDPSNFINGDVVYEFGDGTFTNPPPPNPNPTHTYTSANTFTLKQTAPISGLVFDPSSGTNVGYVTYSQQITVVPNNALAVTSKLCGGGIVKLYINDTRFDFYEIDYGDGSSLVTATHDPSGVTESSHIYSTIATYNVAVKGKFAAGNYCSNADVVLSVSPISSVPKPDVTFMETTVEDLNNGTLTVHFTNTSGYDYQWDFKRNGFSYSNDLGVITSASGTTSIVLDKNNTNPYDPTTQATLHANYILNTAQNSYCFRMATSTACASREVLSDEICSVTKFNVAVADLENDLSWESYAGPNPGSIEVIRDNATLTTLGGTASSYNDLPLTCATNYCYQIKEILTTTSSLGAQYSLGAKKCVTATSLTPRPPITNVNSTINGSDITVTFDPVSGGFTAKSYTISESVNWGDYKDVASNDGSSTTFTLSNRNTISNNYCYKITYTDLCNISPSTASTSTCPIQANAWIAEDGNVVVGWVGYLGSMSVGSYTVEVRDQNGNILHTLTPGSGNSATDILATTNGQLYYLVTSDIGTTSALVPLVLSPAVFVPNAFSPNGDGVNDYFEVKARFINDFKITIFNRWGEPVFHSTNLADQWDGKVNGGDGTNGAYAYTVEATGSNGEKLKQHGTITVAR